MYPPLTFELMVLRVIIFLHEDEAIFHVHSIQFEPLSPIRALKTVKCEIRFQLLEVIILLLSCEQLRLTGQLFRLRNVKQRLMQMSSVQSEASGAQTESNSTSPDSGNRIWLLVSAKLRTRRCQAIFPSSECF